MNNCTRILRRLSLEAAGAESYKAVRNVNIKSTTESSVHMMILKLLCCVIYYRGMNGCLGRAQHRDDRQGRGNGFRGVIRQIWIANTFVGTVRAFFQKSSWTFYCFGFIGLSPDFRSSVVIVISGSGRSHSNHYSVTLRVNAKNGNSLLSIQVWSLLNAKRKSLLR